jgi:hypothetical protein
MTKKSKKSRAQAKFWFAVKSLYRSEIAGEPRVVDEDYDPDGALIEERVVLVRARSGAAALSKGEAEADKYSASLAHVNPYGQKVTWRRVDVIEAYELFDAPANMNEVWSSMSVVPSVTTDTELEDRRFGADEPDDALHLRKKYLDRDLAGDVGLK